MKSKKDIAKASVGIGTAALLGLIAPACTEAEKRPATEKPQSGGTVEPQRADANAPAPQQAEPDAVAPQQAAPDAVAAQQALPDAAQAQKADAGQAIQPYDGPMHLRPGYKSPTRYAVLDPASIINA